MRHASGVGSMQTSAAGKRLTHSLPEEQIKCTAKILELQYV